LFTRNPRRVEIDTPKNTYDTHSGLTEPIDRNEVILYCAFFTAGREAVEQAVALSHVPGGTNPDHGYSDPPGDENDASKLGLLMGSSFADGNVAFEGDVMAKNCIKKKWGDICTLAKAFARNGTFLAADIDRLIGPP